MNQLNQVIKNFGKSIRPTLKKHAADICLVLGIGAGVYALHSCAVEAPKAQKKIDIRKQQLGVSKLPPIEVIKTAWKCYPKTIIAETLSVTALVAGNRIGYRSNAMLTTALAASDAALIQYREQVADVIGEKAEQELAKPILREKEEKIIEVKDTSLDDVIWCKDYYTGKCFWASKESLYKAVNKLNARLLNETRVSYNEFLDLIDVDICGFGYEHEWDVIDGALELIFEPGEMDKRSLKTATIIRFDRDPKKYTNAF